MDELARRAGGGDKAAEEELFHELLVRFRHFAAHRFGDEEADEIAQRACVTILKKYRTEVFSVGFGAWAYGVLRMTIQRYIRDRGRLFDRSARMAERAKSPRTEAPHPMLKRYLLECIRLLARSYPRYSRIVNLHYQGYDTGEICERLRINREQYYVYIGRGRSLLRNCLIEHGVM